MTIVVQIIIMIAAYLISAANQPKPQPPKPATFDDFDFPQVDEGTPQMIVWGDVWIEGWQVLGVGNYRVEPINKSAGKK